MKRIFISYSWNGNEYDQRVVELSNSLTSCGYDVHTDKREMQHEYSIAMQEMMHKQITGADKVIVVLSNGYKIKAEKFAGGVGQEFSLILSDIRKAKRKYILCSLDPFAATYDIAPLAFQSRYIHCLSQDADYFILKAMLEDRLDYGIIDGVEKLQISEQFANEIYRQFLANPCTSYFNYLANAGRVYERISEYNVKLGNWNPDNGWDHTCIYFIATQIKDRYDNKWTCHKIVDEVASDIYKQIEEYDNFMNSHRL